MGPREEAVRDETEPRLGLGNMGTRTYLHQRGVQFRIINPTVREVRAKVAELRAHPRHKGHRGCAEAADLLEILLTQATSASLATPWTPRRAKQDVSGVEVYDWTDKRILPGTIVHYYDEPATPENRMLVVDVTDFDGDVDDDTGRSITIAPYIIVRVADGTRERFPTCEWEHDYCSHSDADGYPAFCHCFSIGKVEELLVWRDHGRERGC